MTARLLNNYVQLVKQLKHEIQSARIKASLTVNTQLLQLYWKIGNAVAEQENTGGWGSKIVTQLSKDLRAAFPDMKGFSVRNLRYMRDFAKAYPGFLQVHLAKSSGNPTLQQPAATIQNVEDSILQVVLAKLTWYHHITLLDKIKDRTERLFYIQKTIENNWSRNLLLQQIEGKLYLRQGKAITNFEQTLPAPQSDLARELMKDPYKFDFLNLYDTYKERDLENALIDNLTRFLLELGAGFSFVGRQYAVEAGDKDYTIDLLFYHFKLHCFVAVELKTGEFLPEYAGKLNFYLNLLDDTLKQPADNETIGILICKERNKIVTEYALRGINKPIGVSEYQLTEALPASLEGSLPTIEQIEKELKDINKSS
jgi:predicted nuclease of restriction endonuclease-like (RecB) superfamily